MWNLIAVFRRDDGIFRTSRRSEGQSGQCKCCGADWGHITLRPMQLTFHTLDVFTNRRFGGNPLAVVLDADHLSTEQMQTITREFNLSETIFVMKPENPANTAKVRIFFPGGEMPFAGIPRLVARCCWRK